MIHLDGTEWWCRVCEQRGVSPVVGVVLLISIVMLLGAVISMFVLGLGGPTSHTGDVTIVEDAVEGEIHISVEDQGNSDEFTVISDGDEIGTLSGSGDELTVENVTGPIQVVSTVSDDEQLIEDYTPSELTIESSLTEDTVELSVSADDEWAEGTFYDTALGSLTLDSEPTEGNVDWSYTIPDDNWVYGLSHYAEDDEVYVAARDYYVHALDAVDGTELWNHDGHGGGVSGVERHGDVVYSTGINFGDTVAYDTVNNEILWREEPGSSKNDVTVNDEGVFVGGAGTGNNIPLHAYNHDGTERAVHDLHSENDERVPTLDSKDGIVYSGDEGGLIVAYDPAEDSVEWTYEHNDEVHAVGVSDGIVYFGDASGNVHAYNPDTGEVIWTSNIHDTEEVTGLAIESGTVYTSGEDHTVAATDASDGSFLWSHSEHTERVLDVDTDSDGTIYSGGRDHEVIAYNEGEEFVESGTYDSASYTFNETVEWETAIIDAEITNDHDARLIVDGNTYEISDGETEIDISDVTDSEEITFTIELETAVGDSAPRIDSVQLNGVQ